MNNGKICYLEIPSTNPEASARFYTGVFGWTTRPRGDGQQAFDDPTGAVSGSWIKDRPPARAPGVLPYIMVDSIEATVVKLEKAGGSMVTPFTSLGGGGAYATFHDPSGNLIGLYEQKDK